MKLIDARDVAIALSLANLCYVRLWAEIFCVTDPSNNYFLKVANVDFIAAALNVVLAAGVFLAATWIARRYGARKLVIAGFVFVLAHQLHFVDPGNKFEAGLLALPEYVKRGRWLDLVGIAAALAAAIFIGWKWPRKSLTVLTTAVYAATPFLFVTFGRAALVLVSVKPREVFASKAPAIDARVPETPGPRVVILVFDAMGRHLALEQRPGGFAMPNLDRLRAQSIDASQVTQAGPLTKISIPSILSGVKVDSTKPAGPAELSVTHDGVTEPWTKMPNLFRKAHEEGGAAVVAGWYHPYCRMYPELDACSWYPTQTVGSSQGQDTGLLETMHHQQIDSFLPYVNRPLRQIDNHKRQLRDARRAVVAGQKGLVFVHMIVAHLPWIWDAERDAFSATNFDETTGYWDQLALVDKTLGELRAEIEAAGKWESTALLVTSDHISRPDRSRDKTDTRVPFILKMPGQTESIAFDQPLNARVAHDLTVAILEGKVSTAPEAVIWLDAH